MTTLALICVILSNLIFAGTVRATLRIRLLMGQGALLSLLPAMLLHRGGILRGLVLVGLTAGIKGFLLPKLLSRSEQRLILKPLSHTDRSLPITNLPGVIAVGIAVWIGLFLIKVPTVLSPVVVSAALSTTVMGLVILICERHLLSQFVGYLLLGNGVFIVGVILAPAQSLLAEFGMLTDLLVVSLLPFFERLEAKRIQA